jgi:N-hydroxyarylamine O-acetyltransferase
VTDALVGRYLAALGVEPEPPSAAGLVRLHRAHVQRFAHDTLWRMRGRFPLAPQSSLVVALVGDEGGGCLQLNAAFVWLLVALGYSAVLHGARVQRAFDTSLSSVHEHAAATVEVDGTRWYADVGLGNGLLEPVPLRSGTFQQPGGFCYALELVGDERWQFHHDRRLLAVRRLELDTTPLAAEDLEPLLRPRHRVDQVVVNRRRPDGVSTLAGDTLVRRGDGRRSVERLPDAVRWERVLREEFLLGLPDWDDDERDRLWKTVCGAPP